MQLGGFVDACLPQLLFHSSVAKLQPHLSHAGDPVEALIAPDIIKLHTPRIRPEGRPFSGSVLTHRC